jgi:hypothetical protein
MTPEDERVSPAGKLPEASVYVQGEFAQVPVDPSLKVVDPIVVVALA